LLHQHKHDGKAGEHLQQALVANPSLTAAQQLLAEINGPRHSAVAQAPRRTIPSYSVSDDSPAAEQTLVANAGNAAEIVNPLAPAGRRSATYRMPPTEEQWSDPAPPPSRLPAADSTEPTVEEAEEGPELNLDAPTMPRFPTRRTAHHDDDLQQPKNLIRLLGTEPQSAPIPSDE
ncbi:MAG TPA: hypothetical protein VL096_11470, partial [Pirellulaceae bacterium]|nr:hypothetical protein [Pirellulaceae bacterium]